MARDCKAIHIRFISKEKGFICRDIFSDEPINIDEDNYKLSIANLTFYEEQTIYIKQIDVSIRSMPGYGYLELIFYKGNKGNFGHNKLPTITSHSLDLISVKIENFLNGYQKNIVDKDDDWDIYKKISRLEKENQELKRRLAMINEIINPNE